MNRKLVFHSERAIVHEFLEFAGLRLATLAVENLLLYLAVDQLKLMNSVSKVGVSIVTVLANYVICQKHIFKKDTSGEGRTSDDRNISAE